MAPDPSAEAVPTAVAYLVDVHDRFHRTYQVYSDADAAGNHFSARGLISSPGDEAAVLPMNEAFTGDPQSGLSSIRATLRSRGANYGGWVFLNGSLSANATAPVANWGETPNAGVNLTGATRLTFRVKGQEGGERVEFFAFGVGRDANSVATTPYPESATRVSTGLLTLTNQWETRALDVAGKDLSYVLAGFGWVALSSTPGRDVVFFLDNIEYNLPQLSLPRLLLSYQVVSSDNAFDRVQRNTAFIYDNAIVALAFMAVKDNERARLIVDAILYALRHDRTFTEPQLRNAYQAGDLALPLGWMPNGRSGTARISGWTDPTTGQWHEDEFQIGTHTGNVAWAMIALLAYYDVTGRTRADVLQASADLGDWIAKYCRDSRGQGGFMGGFSERAGSRIPLGYKSVEHNLDAYAAFERLYLITGNQKWRELSDHALRFLRSMWDTGTGKFWSSTASDGVTTERGTIPLDVQAWAPLALRNLDNGRYNAALEYAESALRFGQGFDFNQDRDGVWYEGTAHMAAAYAAVGHNDKWRSTLAFLRLSQAASGGLYAADRDGLSTGFKLPDNSDWLYFRRVHIGATAWLILAAARVNPFWLGVP